MDTVEALVSLTPDFGLFLSGLLFYSLQYFLYVYYTLFVTVVVAACRFDH